MEESEICPQKGSSIRKREIATDAVKVRLKKADALFRERLRFAQAEVEFSVIERHGNLKSIVVRHPYLDRGSPIR